MTAHTPRNIIPNRRRGENFELRHGGQNTPFIITIGRYPNGDVGEIFISGSKSGTAFEAVARDGAILLSLCLQFGVSLATIKHAITREGDGSPSTIVGAVVDKLYETENLVDGSSTDNGSSGG
jgi:hypothetical protein